MAWFIGQSIVMIAAAFALGILVGWLIWGRAWRRKPDQRSANEATADVPVSVADKEVKLAAAAAAVAEATAAEPEAEDEATHAAPVAVAAADDHAVAVEPEAEAEAGTAEPVSVVPAVAAEPVLVGAAVGEAGPGLAPQAAVAPPAPTQVPDDLERIEGIGPKMAGALHKAGIVTFAQLAQADPATLRRAVESDGLRFAPSIVTWGRQAQLLADGDEEGFADLTRRLVAGRDEGRE